MIKKILASIGILLGYGLILSWCLQAGSLQQYIENDILRFIAANMVVYGWLAIIHDSINFLTKKQ